MQRSKDRGFSLIELMVSVAIFAILTALIVAKYGTFNQGVLFNNLAYDVALTIRTAQTYGISVKNSVQDSSATNFNAWYGIAFCGLGNGCASISTCPIPIDPSTGRPVISFDNKTILLFADNNTNGVCDSGDTILSWSTIKKGGYISCLTSGTSAPYCQTLFNRVDIVFARPSPDAIICINASATCMTNSRPTTLVRIYISSVDGSDKRAVIVRSTGQVTVEGTDL